MIGLRNTARGSFRLIGLFLYIVS